MRIRVKICGVTTPEGALAARRYGADAVGLVFSPSPRQVTLGEARSLSALLGENLSRVAVLRLPSRNEVERIVREFRPDLVQCEAPLGFPPDPIGGSCLLPVVHDGPGVLEEAERVAGGGTVLLEPAGTGGRGATVDWDRAAAIARRVRLILAGGLRPDNVEEAILRVRPYGVDVSSGVESAPGLKDPELVARFLAAVRRAERTTSLERNNSARGGTPSDKEHA